MQPASVFGVPAYTGPPRRASRTSRDDNAVADFESHNIQPRHLKRVHRTPSNLINRDISTGSIRPAAESRRASLPPTVAGDRNIAAERDYYEAVLAQRYASSVFIQKMDSSELVWASEKNEGKMVGPYVLGGTLGQGEVLSCTARVPL